MRAAGCGVGVCVGVGLDGGDGAEGARSGGEAVGRREVGDCRREWDGMVVGCEGGRRVEECLG